MRQKATAFVGKMASSIKLYERRGTSWENAASNIYTGKIGELLAAYHLERVLGVRLAALDFGVREKAMKGWGGDIRAEDGRIFHVKTCEMSNWRDERGPSWGFQYANPFGRGGRDMLFDQPDSSDPVLFILARPNDTGVFIGSAPWNRIIDHLEDPMLKRLVGVKKFAYLRTLASEARRDQPCNHQKTTSPDLSPIS